MRFGLRKPSLSRSFSVKTVGRCSRSIRKVVNPIYGKRGVGIRRPKKKLYNAVYSKTTFSFWDLFK